MMRVAVVILNWNGQKLLEQFLPSIIRHSLSADIYVADNASTDDSIDFIKHHFPSVRIILNSENFGFARGYNEALSHVDADVFALVNSDVEVTQNWLDPIVTLFLAEPETTVIQPKILDFKNKKCFEYAGAAGGFIDKYGFPFCRGRIFDTLEADKGQYDQDCDIFWASGACFFIRSEVFHTLHGFDADFFAHQEEIDLCWRARNEGYSIRYCASSVVYHVGGATLDQGNPQKTYLNFRNSLFMLVKNLPSKQLVSSLLMRMLIDGVAGMRFLLQGKWPHFTAVIRAHGSFYKQIRHNYLKRGKTQEPNYYARNSIVADYFIRGKRFYSDLF
ncbi:MAG TPA: glycosyltransferase family 2 protein [Flavobacterium sp.]